VNVDDHIADQWRDLGFWYDCREDSGWVLRGPVSGLLRFVASLRAYAVHPANDALGEHQHFGPYSYLEVCTGDHAEVNDHCILGTQPDVARFADLLEARLRNARSGDSFDLAKEYSARSTLPFVVLVEGEGFDPASLDPRRGRQPPDESHAY
jgi:hypothetical protein